MILFENVTKTYPRTRRPALEDVSLEVERGEFVFVVGQSGSGKSTLLRLTLKEENATSGSVLVAGRELSQLPNRKVPELRREIGTVFQDFRLLPNKTVYQNVAFALQVIGRPRSIIRQTVPETLKMVGLEGKEKRLPHELSGGEQHEPRHRPPARPDQPLRHDDRHGHARPRDRQRLPQARHRAAERSRHARPGPRWLRQERVGRAPL